MSNQSINEEKMADQVECKDSEFKDNHPYFKARKSTGGLLPTPPHWPRSMSPNRHAGRSKSDGDVKAGGWRTYGQAKQSENMRMKRYHYVNSGTALGTYYKAFEKATHPYYQQNQRSQHIPDRFIKPQVEQRQKRFMKLRVDDEQKHDRLMKLRVDDEQKHDRFMKPRVEKVSAQQFKERTDVKDANAANPQGRDSVGWNPIQLVRRGIQTSPPFCGPFPAVEYGPAPSQNDVTQMYQDMLHNGIVDNEIPTSKENKIKTSADCLRYADSHSFGSFVMTDSKYGNNVMPALPRM